MSAAVVDIPQPYQKGRRCPKCGTAGVGTRFCADKWNAGLYWMGSGTLSTCWKFAGYAPHMHRDCFNCQHSFYERPADSKDSDYTPAAINKRAAADDLLVRESLKKVREQLDAQHASPGAKKGWLR